MTIKVRCISRCIGMQRVHLPGQACTAMRAHALSVPFWRLHIEDVRTTATHAIVVAHLRSVCKVLRHDVVCRDVTGFCVVTRWRR
jgi:hypothetical protein